jgi:N6-L-threonylcarbamoyladenine synthase
MTDRPGLDFSFSGIKTHSFTTLAGTQGTEQDKADIAAGFEAAVVDTLVIKSRRALDQTGIRRLVVAGGVSANVLLRRKLSAMAREKQCRVYFPRLEFCGDNGAMIAYAGWRRLACGAAAPPEIRVHPRWPLTELAPP